MKRKKSSLEKQLRRPEATLPQGLRLRALRRMGLRSAAPAWFAPPAVWAPVLAGLLVAGFIWKLNNTAPAVDPGYRPETAGSERSRELAYASRHPGTAGPTTAMEVLQAQALLHAEDAGALLSGRGPEAVTVQSLPAASNAALGAEPAQSVQELRAAPASSEGSLRDGRGNVKEPQREAYRLTVKHNRIRPAFNEQVLLELQAGASGAVRMRVIDLEGRLVKDLVELSDSSGPIVARWDGLAADRQPVPSGAYTIIIQSPQKTEKVGVLVIR